MVQASPAEHPPLEQAAYLATSSLSHKDVAHTSDITQPAEMADTRRTSKGVSTADDDEWEMKRPPYLHVMLSGGLGGTTGDMLMHSLDTVKTRQQGDPHLPPRYTSLGSSYFTILRQEGIRRGLYSGVLPAFVGSFTGTVAFFGSYEMSKRWMLDAGVTPTIAYFSGGLVADLVASPLYVPTEVLKTRLQLQGRYNNPFFQSGYNYRNTFNALSSIIKNEGWAALFYGYKATLFRDLPFSALQFAFWEQEQKVAKRWVGGDDIGVGLELLTGASAGGMAGIITCPLDVVKTRIQTQVNFIPSSSATVPSTSSPQHPLPSSNSTPAKQQQRPISTSSPSTSLRAPSAALLDTSSVVTGLRILYNTEGITGLFRGVGPRAIWTSVQSGTMLFMYQALLRWFERYPLVETASYYDS